MAFDWPAAPWREQHTCAENARYTTLLRSLWQHIKPRRHIDPRALDPHLMRDIGLPPNEVALHQHRWPSQHSHHPRG